MRRVIVFLSVVALMVAGALMPPVAASEARPVSFTVFVSADFTFTEGVCSWGWQPGSTVTLEIDNGNNGSVDYSMIGVADIDGSARFDANEQFSVTEGDLVRVHDNLIPQTVKETAVRYLTLTELDADGDTVSGTARPGEQVYLFFGNEDHTQVGSAVADGAGLWTCVTSYDLVPGTSGFVQTADEDGDHTQINWEVPRPEGWQYNPATNHYYLLVQLEESTTWQEAEAYAVTLGGHLVTINDAAENAWLIETLGVGYWIGFNDLAVEGEWVWASGEDVTFTDWLEGEPNDYLGEDVAQLENRPPTGWNDVSSELGDLTVVEVAEIPLTLEDLLDEMVDDGRLPSERVAQNILKKVERGQISALTRYLSALVRRGLITQATMDEILAAAF